MQRPVFRFFSLAMIFLLLASLYPWVVMAGTSQVDNPTLSPTNRSLASFLRPDGTLDLPAGFAGSLDPAGYRLASKPGETPRFVPADDGDEYWVSGFGPPGMNDYVSALAVDGAGNLFAGGKFIISGGVSANRIARWNGSSWSALGSGMNSEVRALAVDGAGNLYAGGAFTTAGGINANYIARWNGSSWLALGSGMDFWVSALAVDGAGNLYAGGYFTTAGGVSASNIARWNGSSWSPLGSGINNGVGALAVDGAGNLYAGGYFTTAGGVSANNIARWNGSSWSALGSGMNNYVRALAVDTSGNLYAGGSFTTAGGVSANRMAKWNGSSWSPLGSGMNNYVSALAVDAAGNLYAGGAFVASGGVSTNRIARWNGSSWSALGSGMNNFVYSVAVDGSGNLYAGGTFTTAGGMGATSIARWNGSSWSALGSGSGMNDQISALAMDGAGNLYAGGAFVTAGGVSANYIARWNGSSWLALGSGMDFWVSDLAVDAAGNLFAGGGFTTAGGVSANYIAQWDGTAWSALGSGMGGSYPGVSALAVDGAGNLYAGGWFTTAGGVSANYIAKWNGSSWSALGSGMNDRISALAMDGAGNLYAGGAFVTAGGVSANYIAKWNGSSWSALGSGMNGDISALAVDGAGNLYAGGWFTTAGGVSANYIAKWNGSSWSALGSGMNNGVSVLSVEAAGNLYAGGGFTTAGGVSANYIAKWNGSSWSALGSGMNNSVYDLAMDAVGNLYAAGQFTASGGKPSSHIAQWTGGVEPSGPPVILVHGWQGMNTDPQQWRTCTSGVEPYDPNIPTHSQWGTIASGLRAAGFSVYIANLDSNPFSTPPLEWNAECLQAQVEEVAQQHQEKVILIGHNMGGLVSRAYLEDDTLYRDKVAQVLTLGSPHGGVNYNPVFLSPGVCTDDPAACQFTHAGMHWFNQTHDTRAQNVTYSLVGGIWDSLKSRLISITDGPNDSVVGLVSATGRYWPEELGIAVGGAVGRYQTVATHSGEDSYMYDPATLSCIKNRLGLPGTCIDVTLEHTAVTDVPLLSQQTAGITGQLNSGQVASTTLTIDTDGASLFVLDWIGSSLAFTLTSPSGTSITPAYAAANPSIVTYATQDATGETPAWAGYWFTDTVPGPWTLWVQSTAMPPATSTYAASAWLETARTLSAGTNANLYHVGDTAVITASLSTDGIGITGANVVAELQLGNGMTDTATLSHEGSGNYTASYVIPDVPGYVFGQVRASGNDGSTPFTRQADVMFAIASAAVQLTGNYSERTPDDNGDGRYDTLLIDVGIDATHQITLSLSASLASPGITTTLTSITTTVVPIGSHVLTLHFPGRSIHRIRASGPYTVTDVLLQDFSLGGVVAQTGSNVYSTQPYDYRQFGLLGDVDNSCVVDISDLIAIASAWSTSDFNPDYDLDLDHQITVADVMLAAGNWEASCWE